ncbi:1,2-phenylacetyl-CoA epoxidase subunit PaaD [Luteococcus sp. H138]|uniref:1,2-phenylacetyl-CoA epoxidase subunit PaaD n=1 Tax=unclassified Luteococcus TaxID=2639923 RepID=UPI00313DC7ED
MASQEQVIWDGSRPSEPRAAAVWDAAATVPDPEIPVIGIDDLGILRGVELDDAQPQRAVVVITPTYSGCPAMGQIAADVTTAVREIGFAEVEIRTVLHPAWTTDWMSDKGRAALEEYGIAPPSARQPDGPVDLAMPMLRTDAVRCPRCKSFDVKELSRFASTSCKALYQCRACAEPFDYFKVL